MLHPKIADIAATHHILKAFDLRASKKLGQNFLIDSAVVHMEALENVAPKNS